MPGNGPETPQSWPRQGHQTQYIPPVHAPPRQSFATAWALVGLGIFIPLFALVAGLWALSEARHGERGALAVAIAGLSVFALRFLLLA